jgi:hypothetical protein
MALQSRDIIRIAATSVPIIAAATLISLGVLPQLAALWWGILIASVVVSILVSRRTVRTASSPGTQGDGRG